MVKRDGEVVEPSEPSEEESRADLREHYDIVARARGQPRAADADRARTAGSSAATRPGWSIPGRASTSTSRRCYEAIDERGGLGGVVLTHDHQDHSEAARTLTSRYDAPLAAGRGAVDVALSEGAASGPFDAPSPRPATPPTTSR